MLISSFVCPVNCPPSRISENLIEPVVPRCCHGLSRCSVELGLFNIDYSHNRTETRDAKHASNC